MISTSNFQRPGRIFIVRSNLKPDLDAEERMNVYAKGMPNELLRLQKMHNGEKAVATFSAAEMTRRQDGLRSILAELKLDAAVLTSYHNICYFSDFMFCYFGRRYAFVVTPEKAVSVSAGIDAGRPWRRTF